MPGQQNEHRLECVVAGGGRRFHRELFCALACVALVFLAHRMVKTHWNSPAIVVWTIFNEDHGEFDPARLVDEVRSLDPTRLVNEASGWRITGAGDVNDVHSYPASGIRPATPTQALVDGEFGGIGQVVPGHAWQFRGDGYINAGTPTICSISTPSI